MMKIAVGTWTLGGRTPVLFGLLLVLIFGCGRQDPGKARLNPSNFTSGVQKAEAETQADDLAHADSLAREEAAADAKAEKERKIAELAKDTALFNLDTAKEKMATLQSKLTNAEAKKNSLSDRINTIDVELASIVVPSGRSIQAAVAFVSGNYLAAGLAKNQAVSAKNAALTKKMNLRNLRALVASDLEAATQAAADLESQIEALDQEIYEATGKAYSQF